MRIYPNRRPAEGRRSPRGAAVLLCATLEAGRHDALVAAAVQDAGLAELPVRAS